MHLLCIYCESSITLWSAICASIVNPPSPCGPKNHLLDGRAPEIVSHHAFLGMGSATRCRRRGPTAIAAPPCGEPLPQLYLTGLIATPCGEPLLEL